jgi:hypothetical protein
MFCWLYIWGATSHEVISLNHHDCILLYREFYNADFLWCGFKLVTGHMACMRVMVIVNELDPPKINCLPRTFS